MKKLLLNVLIVLGFVLPVAGAAHGQAVHGPVFVRSGARLGRVHRRSRLLTEAARRCRGCERQRDHRERDVLAGRSHRRPDQEEPAVRDRQGRRHDEGVARPAPGEGLVRRHAARPLGDRALAGGGRQGQRRRLSLHPVAHLLRDDKPTGWNNLAFPTSPCRMRSGSCRTTARPFVEVKDRTTDQDIHRFAGFEQITPGARRAPVRRAVGDLVAYLQWMATAQERTAPASACSSSSACSS